MSVNLDLKIKLTTRVFDFVRSHFFELSAWAAMRFRRGGDNYVAWRACNFERRERARVGEAVTSATIVDIEL